MPGMPAARVTDMHTCAICMGAPMPIMPPGAPTVLIDGLPAARMSDMSTLVSATELLPISFASPSGLLVALLPHSPDRAGGRVAAGGAGDGQCVG